LVVARRAREWKQVTQTIDIEAVMREFVLAKRAEHSPKTARWYEQTCTYFLAFLKENHHSTRLADIGISQARAFVVALQGRPRQGTTRPLSSHSINSWARALRAFFSWLYQNDYTDEHRLKNLRPPKPTEVEIEILRPEQVQALLNACSPRTATGCRNRAMVMLMLDAGLRLEEVATLLRADVHIDEGWLRVKGKGNKERVVPFGRNLQQVLTRYVTTFRPEATSQPATFLLTLRGDPLTGWGIQTIIQRLGPRAGLPNLHAHLLRHTFATNYLLYNCGDAFRLQQILGHTTLEMTRRYVHMAGREQALLTTKVSPTDRLGVSLTNQKLRKASETPGERAVGDGTRTSAGSNARAGGPLTEGARSPSQTRINHRRNRPA
jgi:site-specific recombinase XerD